MVNIDELLPSAKDILQQAALKEAEKAEEQMRHMAAVAAEKRALIEELTKPSGLSEDEKIKRASTVIQRAVKNGLKEVQVKKAVDLSADKYCSASIMLGQAGVEITHDYIIEEDGPEKSA